MNLNRKIKSNSRSEAKDITVDMEKIESLSTGDAEDVSTE